MKNSIFITTNLSKNTGGGGVSSHELNSLIKSTNVKLILANKEIKEFNENSIPVNSIYPPDHKLPNNEFLYDYLACEKVDQIKDQIDIVVINGNPFGKTVSHILKNRNPKNPPKNPKIIVCVPAHDLEESKNEHYKFNINYDEMYPHMVDPFLWKMQTDHIRKADIIICPSEYSKNALKKLNLIDKQYVEIIPHGIDLPTLGSIQPISDIFIVGYMGSCLTDKGIIYAISAWNQLAYQDSLFLYAGYHESIFKDYIYRIEPQKGAKYVILGFVQNISELYNNISVYIQPSVTEGFGIELIEALSFGRPVVCSDGAGASELITDGVEGFIFPKRDVNRLIQYIQYFKDNPAEVKRMGLNARKKAENYTWEIIEKKYAELFTKNT